MDTNNQTTFHPADDAKQKMEEERKIIADHVSMHYRKYLFGVGVISGLMMSLMVRMGSSTNFFGGQIMADSEKSPEIQALAVFDNIMSLTHEKDNFFHLSGKIYTLTGEILFKKYDTMYHMLDNSYHQALSLQERIKRAKRFLEFIIQQDKLFAATEYENGEYNRAYKNLDKQFNDMLLQIPTPTEEIEITTDSKENTGNKKTIK
ncbi:MAG: hypothetical protein WC010_03390 [Candidatus Absconditabacterales bacterium]